MSFTSSTVANVFIIIGIVVGGLLLIIGVGYCVWRWIQARRLVPGKGGAFKEQQDANGGNDAVSVLSKISRDQWHQRGPGEARRPIVMEKDQTGQVLIKNPSVLSKSEYRHNPEELAAMKKQDQNVGTLLKPSSRLSQCTTRESMTRIL